MLASHAMPRLVLLICLMAASVVIDSRAATAPVVGRLDITGSTTLAELVMGWGEQLERRYPGVHVQVQATGSSTAPPALTQGTSRIGAMSRRMTDSELATFKDRHGYAPVAVPVAIDALAVFVHRDNPLDAVGMRELDAIFSDTRRCGLDASIERWGELGLAGHWRHRPIDLHGRNSASGTYSLFRREVLCHGDFRPRTNEYPGSSAVVAAVADSLGGIGYGGMDNLTAAVKPLALINDAGQRVQATTATTTQGLYPLARPLYLYVGLVPGAQLPLLERAFFELVLSPAGQARVHEAGLVALPEATLQDVRRTLNLHGP